MHLYQLTYLEIIIRLIIAILMGGAIGFEREYKSRPAGMRTHILVCVGATLLALIQEQITAQTVDFAQAQPKLIQILTADQTRIIAQIVSGIGFLGAGTIIMTKQTVKGLTTAASVWAVAAVGIALGSGLYVIAVTGFIAIMIALAVISYLVPLPRIRRLQVEIENGEETVAYIQKFLKERQVLIENLDLKITRETIEAKRKYLIMFTLTVPKDVDEDKLVIELSDHIEKELFEKRIWLDKEVLYNDAAIARTMPGVIALNNALLVGKRVNGVIGMLTAGFGSIFPAVFLMSVATYFYQLLPNSGPILTALMAIRATSCAFLFAACYSLASYTLETPLLKITALGSLILSFFL